MTQKIKDIKSKDEVVSDNPMRILEDALVICKFGWFNIQVMVATLLSVLATTAVPTAPSYILSSAECDLEMTLIQKGTLNAIPFLGQVCSAMFTGFITDAFGRKIFLAGGNFGMFIVGVIGACSQTYPMLLVTKLLEGVVMMLVFSATSTMVTEFTHKNIRDRVLMCHSSFMSFSIIVAALLAWAVLPLQFRFTIVEKYFVINPWNLYLFTSACWSFLAACMYWYLPESPKFLLSHGDERGALKVLKRIYRTNTGKDEDSFPLTSLNVPGGYKVVENVSIKKKITTGLLEVKELFKPPLIFKLFLFSSITFVCLLLYSALRLWYPQLSTIIEGYQREHEGRTDRFCVMMDSNLAGKTSMNSSIEVLNSKITEPVCVPILPGTDTYTNGMMLGFVSFVCILSASYVVKWSGQKPLIFTFFVLCGVCASALYWASSSIIIAILISATCAFMQTAFSLQQSILVRVFPTSVRTVAYSIVIMFGRIGSLIGNITFPILLEIGCMVPFIMLSVVTFAVAGFIYFLPNPRKENNGTGDK